MFLTVDQLCSQFRCLLYCVLASKCSTLRHRYGKQSFKYVFFYSFPISYRLSFLYLIWLLPSILSFEPLYSPKLLSLDFTKLIIHPKTNALCFYGMKNLVIKHFAASQNLISTGIYTQNRKMHLIYNKFPVLQVIYHCPEIVVCELPISTTMSYLHIRFLGMGHLVHSWRMTLTNIKYLLYAILWTKKTTLPQFSYVTASLTQWSSSEAHQNAIPIDNIKFPL